MRVPEFFLTSVCFLCVENPVGSAEKYKYGGTAFFVSVPSLGKVPAGVLCFLGGVIPRATYDSGRTISKSVPTDLFVWL